MKKITLRTIKSMIFVGGSDWTKMMSDLGIFEVYIRYIPKKNISVGWLGKRCMIFHDSVPSIVIIMITACLVVAVPINQGPLPLPWASLLLHWAPCSRWVPQFWNETAEMAGLEADKTYEAKVPVSGAVFLRFFFVFWVIFFNPQEL